MGSTVGRYSLVTYILHTCGQKLFIMVYSDPYEQKVNLLYDHKNKFSSMKNGKLFLEVWE